MTQQHVIIVGNSPELDLALDALAEWDPAIRVVPTLREARSVLPGAVGVDVVLVDLRASVADGVRLIRSVRRAPGLRSVPVVVWARTRRDLLAAYRAGATSGVLLPGVPDDPIRLTTLVHYWTVVSEPSVRQAFA